MAARPGVRERVSARAGLLARVREFFAARGVLETETPLLCRSGVTDLNIEPLIVERGESLDSPRYLQTSPEYAMKRLLAQGSGAIYQLARAFRDGEAGRRHNPEFTLLEWYRPGFDLPQLMAEVADLVEHCLGPLPRQTSRYRDLFRDHLGVDPFTAPLAELEALARRHLELGAMPGDRDLWLDLLMSHLVEPRLDSTGMHFVHGYPASQAALAQVVECEGQPEAQRFELFVRGVELANGYLELTDPAEQRRRFERDNARRRELGRPERPLDERLLAALEAGLPPCSGVALGFDRLLMLATGTDDIRDVLAFGWEEC